MAEGEKQNSPETNLWSQVKIPLATPRDYEWAERKGRADDLEEAERQFLSSVLEATKVYDAQVAGMTGQNPDRVTAARALLSKFEDAVSALNLKDLQLSEKTGMRGEVFEETKTLTYSWQCASLGELQAVHTRHGYTGTLAFDMVESAMLEAVNSSWFGLAKLRREIGLGATPNDHDTRAVLSRLSPCSAALGHFQTQMINLELGELEVFVSASREAFDFGSPQSPSQARDKAMEKAKADYDFSEVSDKYSYEFDQTDRTVVTHTIDTETGIRFATTSTFRKSGRDGEFKRFGRPHFSALGSNGEIYTLSPNYRLPDAYKFRPYYFDFSKSPYALYISPEQEIGIWRAYCRAVCDTPQSQEEFRKSAERRGLQRVYWGFQEQDLEAYVNLLDRLKIAGLIKAAETSTFGRVRLGINIRESGLSGEAALVPEATANDTAQVDELFEKYWQNPHASELVFQDNASWGYFEFSYPYGSGTSVYPDDCGKVIGIRLSDNRGRREILIRDAYEPGNFGKGTKYLRAIRAKDHWNTEKGRYSTSDGAYHLTTEESREIMSKQDAETVMLALGLLTSPKRVRER
ncbi:MAG TPA: hypothetical protein VMW25_02695 [Clostridia bacterium]|nr:hypothetical protein [Clostridia bacterium]